MPICRRHFERGQLQFITTSTYRRARLFACQRFPWIFVAALRQLRQQSGFLLNGWVLMPDHFHLLIRPEPPEATVCFMQELKRRTAPPMISALTRHPDRPRCRALLARLALPPTVLSDCYYRVWQRRYVPFNVFTHNKHMEKFDYMHPNPVTAGLVPSPDRWPWSSFRFYYLDDSFVLSMDRIA